MPRRAARDAAASTVPVLTEPAVPMTRNGTSPASRSASIALRNADSPSAGRGRWGCSGPSRCRDREVGDLLDPGVGPAEVYARSSAGRLLASRSRPGSSTSPCARARRAMKFAMSPPSYSRAPADVGSRSARRSSAPSGPRPRSRRRQHAAAQFGLTAAASRSPSMPIGAGRRRDVAEEPRVPVEQRVLEQQPRGRGSSSAAGSVAPLGQRTVERERVAHRAATRRG